MGFILTKKSGAVEGEEFIFEDGGEARIGRTHGNDIVVNDHEASRHHAHIFETDEGCFVEDLDSSNGTFVNGEELPSRTPFLVHSGDVIGVGSGELVFWEQSANAAGKSDSQEESTVIKPVEELEAEHQAQSALAVAPRASKPVRRSSSQPARAAPIEKVAPIDKAASIDKRQNQRAKAAQEPKSAAERAREQRKALKSFWGRLGYAFSTLDAKKRRLVMFGLVAVVLVVLAGVFYLLYSEETQEGPGNEPKSLVVNSERPLKDSFGFGKDVTWPNVDAKQFEFHVVSPGKMVAVIRYYAKDISSQEVDIQFNNVSLGSVPPDTLNVDTREIELVVSPQLIRNDEMNTILFDNVRNPPGKETWRIWGLSIEVEPVPSFTSMAEAQAAIERSIKNGQYSYDAKNIAPANLYEAWRHYRRAWLITESLETKNTGEYEFILAKYRDTRRELDELCSKYMLEFMRLYNTAFSEERIVGLLEDVIKHFPRPDHDCHRRAKEALEG